MLSYKRAAAFLMSLLIGAYAAAAPMSVYADEEDILVVSDEIEEYTPEVSDSEYKTSGAFTYSLTYENTACIEDCTSTDANLVIPDTIDGIQVTELGKTAFGTDYESNPFESIYLPASIEYISEENPFIYCTELTEIIVDSANTEYSSEDGILFNKDKTKLVCYPQKKSGSSYTVPDGVTEIGVSAMYNTLLESITIPSTLTALGRHAMNNIIGLKSIDLSNTAVKVIPSFAFSSCGSLSEVLLPDTLEDIEGAAFAMCGALKEITLPESLKTIGQYAFYDTGLSCIFVPTSVQDIGYCAFGYYTNENGEEKADGSFQIIGQYYSAAHSYAYDTDSDYGYANSFPFYTPEEYEEQRELLALDRVVSGDYEYAIIGDRAALTACYSSEEVLNVPSEIDGYTIYTVYPVAFTYCGSSEIILPETIETLREMSFYNCQYLKKVTLPQSLKTVGNNVFDTCLALQSVDLGGAEEIGSNIFYDCIALKSVTISGNCKTISDAEPFVYCSALEEINVTDGDGEYCAENGVLYNKDKTILIAYPAAKEGTKFTVPSSVAEIAQSAFLGCRNLEEIDLSVVTVINDYAFERCEKLSSAKLSKELTAVGTDAFYGCTALKSLRLYDKLETIGDYAFGFYHNEAADTANGEETDAIVDGFKIYAEEGTNGYQYAQNYGIEVVSGTIELFGANIDITFLYVLGVGAAAVIAAVIGIFVGKKIKKKKASKGSKKGKDEKNEKILEGSDDDTEENDEEQD